MPSADLFLRLLEEKELVSAEVLKAARREGQGSPPPDAIKISLWLVQGQHITASQAERLLAAAAERSETAGPKAPPKESFSHVGKTPKSPPPPKPQRSPARDDEELALLDEDAGKAGRPAAAASPPTPPAAASVPAPPAPSPLGKPDAEGQAVGKIGGELEPLKPTMKGPLDSLIESEMQGADGFDDPFGAQLGATAHKKFSLRRALRKIFRRNKSKVVRIKAADPRQVKIVVFSWAAAIALMVGLLIVMQFLSGPGETEILQKADKAAKDRDFALAIKGYDDFLTRFPKSPSAGDVRVRRGLAELCRAEDQAHSTGDWAPAFEVATTEVKSLPTTFNDTDSMREFGVTLARIGGGLAQQAQAKRDVASVEQAQKVLNMFDSDVPSNFRPPDVMLEDIRQVLKPVKHAVEERRELDASLVTIRAAAEASDVKAAYAAYRDALKLFPEIADDQQLTDAMKQVSAVQQKAVKAAAQSLAAMHDDRPSDLLASMPLAVQQVKGELAQARGRQCFVVERGTAYGLDAASGRVLWRRFVALDPRLPPVSVTSVAAPAGDDALVCDPVHRELSRVRGATGELAWRLAVDKEIVAGPTIAGQWLLLLTGDRRLEVIEAMTGGSQRFLELPQSVRLAPVADPAHGMVFLAADQSNLFVFDGDVKQCLQVMHVGHEAGTISAPPAVVGDFLLLPVNSSPSEAAIRIYSIAKDKAGGPLAAAQAIPVAGSIDMSPVAWGSGAAVVTAQGGLYALARTKGNATEPFQPAASRPVSLNVKSAHYLLPNGNTFLVADRQLTRYATSGDRILPTRTIDLLGMEFVHAPRTDDGAMFAAVKRPAMRGVTVAAFNLDKLDDQDSAWQTWVAAPLVAEPTLGAASGKLTAVTASGGMFRGSPAALPPPEGTKAAIAPWEPVLTVDSGRLSKPLASLLPLPGEMFAMTSGADTNQIVIYDPREQDKQFRRLLSPKEMSVGPGAFAHGLLVPCVDGEVFLLDLEAQGQMARPLPPALQDVKEWNWRTPVAVDDKLAALCDGDKRLMIVNIANTDDGKALAETAAATLKTELTSPVAVVGKVVFVADATDSLLSFSVPGLTSGRPLALGSRCIFGPRRLGDFVLVATAKGRLFCVNEQQEVVWQADLKYGPLSGAPFLAGDDIYLSAQSGMVWRVSAASGKELGKVDAGCPLGTGPMLIGTRLIVGGHDGSLLELKKP
jgi:outer membrane protein assembly factor BamB